MSSKTPNLGISLGTPTSPTPNSAPGWPDGLGDAILAIDSALGGAASIRVATVTLSSAQLKSLNASPVQIIAAPGSGKSLYPCFAFLQFKFGSTPYTIPTGDGSIALTAPGADAATDYWVSFDVLNQINVSHSTLAAGPISTQGRLKRCTRISLLSPRFETLTTLMMDSNLPPATARWS